MSSGTILIDSTNLAIILGFQQLRATVAVLAGASCVLCMVSLVLTVLWRHAKAKHEAVSAARGCPALSLVEVWNGVPKSLPHAASMVGVDVTPLADAGVEDFSALATISGPELTLMWQDARDSRRAHYLKHIASMMLAHEGG